MRVHRSLVAFLLLNIVPFLWIFLSLGLGKRFYGDMTGSVGKSAEDANIDRSLTFDDVAGERRRVRQRHAYMHHRWMEL